MRTRAHLHGDWRTRARVRVSSDSGKFDEDFPYDDRVYFHFDNKEQFEQAKTKMLEDVGFIVLKVLDDETGEDE